MSSSLILEESYGEERNCYIRCILAQIIAELDGK